MTEQREEFEEDAKDIQVATLKRSFCGDQQEQEVEIDEGDEAEGELEAALERRDDARTAVKVVQLELREYALQAQMRLDAVNKELESAQIDYKQKKQYFHLVLKRIRKRGKI
jgi:uncharacterized protein YhfF